MYILPELPRTFPPNQGIDDMHRIQLEPDSAPVSL